MGMTSPMTNPLDPTMADPTAAPASYDVTKIEAIFLPAPTNFVPPASCETYSRSEVTWGATIVVTGGSTGGGTIRGGGMTGFSGTDTHSLLVPGGPVELRIEMYVRVRHLGRSPYGTTIVCSDQTDRWVEQPTMSSGTFDVPWFDGRENHTLLQLRTSVITVPIPGLIPLP